MVNTMQRGTLSIFFFFAKNSFYFMKGVDIYGFDYLYSYCYVALEYY